MINWKFWNKEEKTEEVKKFTYEEKFYERVIFIIDSVDLSNIKLYDNKISIKDEYEISIDLGYSSFLDIKFNRDDFRILRVNPFFKKIKKHSLELKERKLNEKYVKCIEEIDDKNIVVARKAKLKNM
jgi:hypothetical protein